MKIKLFAFLLLLLIFAGVSYAQSNAPGAFGPTLGGSGSSSPSSLAGNVYAVNYGVKADGHTVWDATFTLNSSTITCGNLDCNFNGADSQARPIAKLGQIVFGTNAQTTFQANASVIVPQGFICAINGANSITVGATYPGCAANNANANCTPTGLVGCLLVWGDDDTGVTGAGGTGLLGAWFAAVNTPVCSSLILPPGLMLTQKGQFNANPTLTGPCLIGAGNTLQGPSVIGQGAASETLIVPTPNFDPTTCTGGVLGNGCFFSAQAITVRDMTLFGAGNGSLSGGFNGKAAVYFNGGTIADNAYVHNLTNVGWGASTPGFIGLQTSNASEVLLDNVATIGTGQTNCLGVPTGTGGTTYFVVAIAIQCVGAGATSGGNIAIGLQLGSAAGGVQWLDTSGYYGNVNGTAGAQASIGVQVNSNDVLIGDKTQIPMNNTGGANPGVNGIALQVPGSGYVDCTGCIISNSMTVGSGVSRGITIGNGTGIVHLRGSQVSATATGGVALLTTAGTSLFDDLGNKFTSNSVESVSGNFFGITNSATGTACATGNFALTSGWGTSSVASVAANGNIQGCHVTVTGAAGAAGPVLTWTYPAAPPIAPASCHLSGASGTLTGVSTGTPGATTVAYTFTGTPSAQTYNFDVGCP